MNRQARGGGNSNCRWAGFLIVAGQRVAAARGTLAERSERCSGKRRHGLHRRCRGGRRLAWGGSESYQMRDTSIVFVSTEVDKIPQRSGLSSVWRRNPSSGLLGQGGGQTPSERNARPNIGGRITWPRPREDETNGGCLPSPVPWRAG